MFAILEDAVLCFQDYVSAEEPARKKLFVDAERWLLDDNNEWPFSFSNICREIHLDKDFVRAGLMRWKNKTAASPVEKPQEKSRAKVTAVGYAQPIRTTGRNANKARAVG